MLTPKFVYNTQVLTSKFGSSEFPVSFFKHQFSILGSEEPKLLDRKEELKREFEVKYAKLIECQRELLEVVKELIKKRNNGQQDIAEEDVTNYLKKTKEDPETYCQLKDLRLLGFLRQTKPGEGIGTVRYGLSSRYQDYFSNT